VAEEPNHTTKRDAWSSINHSILSGSATPSRDNLEPTKRFFFPPTFALCRSLCPCCVCGCRPQVCHLFALTSTTRSKKSFPRNYSRGNQQRFQKGCTVQHLIFCTMLLYEVETKNCRNPKNRALLVVKCVIIYVTSLQTRLKTKMHTSLASRFKQKKLRNMFTAHVSKLALPIVQGETRGGR